MRAPYSRAWVRTVRFRSIHRRRHRHDRDAGHRVTQTGCFEVQQRAKMEEINKEQALIGKKVEAEAAGNVKLLI